MNNNIEKELELINWQQILSIVGIIILVTSYFISENVKLRISGNIPFWTEEEEKTISLLTRLAFFGATAFEVYIAYQKIKLNENDPMFESEDVATNLVFIGAVLAAISALFILWAGIVNVDDEIMEVIIPPIA